MSDATQIQLRAVGVQNTLLNLEQIAIEINDTPFQWHGNCYKNIVSRTGDIHNPSGLIIKSSLNITEIWSKIHDIRLIIGGNIIFKINNEILKMISEVINTGTNEWLFKIKFDILIGSIPIYALMYHNITFEIHVSDTNGIDEIRLINTYKFVENTRALLEQQCELPIQQFQGGDYEFQEQTEMRIRCNFDLLCKGFFINGNIDNISNITLKLNNHTRYSYNTALIHYACKRINSNTLYIPFNPGANWMENTFSSYEGSLNTSRIDNMEMIINFNRPERKIGLYAINNNTLRILHGMAGLRMGGGLMNSPADSVARETFTPMTFTPMIRPSHSIGISSGVIQMNWTSSTKIISPDKAYCSISLENINEGDEYCECAKCNNCFLAESLKTSFTHLAKKCPLCRETWTNWIVYENSENNETV
jgi:hypothetical protein